MKPQKHADKLFNEFYVICQEYTEEIHCSLQAIKCALAVNERERQAKINAYKEMYEFQPDVSSQAAIFQNNFHNKVTTILKRK